MCPEASGIRDDASQRSEVREAKNYQMSGEKMTRKDDKSRSLSH